ncbi:hypothetical protein K440DRAFT_645416 [Wilcoxina mikolae CBS 423.85]|nr:hypothetical protein K440DRAFT_645416 [Wilcoxina mikolae CBS 423.85]
MSTADLYIAANNTYSQRLQELNSAKRTQAALQEMFLRVSGRCDEAVNAQLENSVRSAVGECNQLELAVEQAAHNVQNLMDIMVKEELDIKDAPPEFKVEKAE